MYRPYELVFEDTERRLRRVRPTVKGIATDDEFEFITRSNGEIGMVAYISKVLVANFIDLAGGFCVSTGIEHYLLPNDLWLNAFIDYRMIDPNHVNKITALTKLDGNDLYIADHFITTVPPGTLKHELIAQYERYRLFRNFNTLQEHVSKSPGYNFELAFHGIANNAPQLNITYRDVPCVAVFVLGPTALNLINKIDGATLGIGIISRDVAQRFKELLKTYQEGAARL